MNILKKNKTTDAHPYVPELKDLYRQGRISRREFLRMTTLLGLSATSAGLFLAGCATQPAAVPAATNAPAAAAATAVPTKAPTQPPPTITRGGHLRVAGAVGRVDHPARFSWLALSQPIRLVAEYLTFTGTDNITRPWLLEKWEASEDVKTWTLYLRKGIKFNNGDELQSADVIKTMQDWFNKEVGSSMLGLMSYLQPTNIEKVDDYTIKLHLDSGQITVPDNLFHYPAQIMHRNFEGDFIKQPIGTGPFTLKEYAESERAVLAARKDYWKNGEDGSPLPYLDQITYIDLGGEETPQVAALQAGTVDVVSEAKTGAYQALKDDPKFQFLIVPNGSCNVMRMRVDQEPWTDVRVRQALKLCQDREKMRSLAFFGLGDLGADFHVSPIHPEYCQKPIPKYDPEKAKALLAEAGHPNGLQVELTVGSDVADNLAMAEALKASAAAGGFDIKLNAIPINSYWNVWTEVPFGVTNWLHRPLGTMLPRLAYSADADGKPVAWNESRWVDKEFSDLLTEAERTLDVEKRRAIFCKMEDIQQERGSVAISFFLASFATGSKKVQNLKAHPSFYNLLDDVWLKEA